MIDHLVHKQSSGKKADAVGLRTKLEERKSLRIVCVADTHGLHGRFQVPDGDVLIHAGDFSNTGSENDVLRFAAWIERLPHRHKIVIAGNHDWFFQRQPEIARHHIPEGVTYLQDESIEIGGINFWGTPWQPWFMDWAFNLPRKSPAIREKWNMIPMDTDVLVTHGPPHGILDQVRRRPNGLWSLDEGTSDGPLGCEELKIRIKAVNPALHVFGHIHDGHGLLKGKQTTFVNASICNEAYEPVNPAMVLDLCRRKDGVLSIRQMKNRPQVRTARGSK